MKRIAIAAAVVVCALGPSVGAQTTTVPTYSSYGADAGGTGVHSLAASNAFPNFRTGAVDNSYPLATSHLDLSATQATASVADSGPLGATAAGQANGAQQPQYATASYPGHDKASLTQGGSVAEAQATSTSAHSRGSVAAATSNGPAAVEKKDDGAQTSSDYGESGVAITPDTGEVVATGDGRVDRATFAGGVFVVSGAHVTAQVRIADGVATPAYTIDAGNMTVNGTAVKVTDKGVEAANPTGNDALQQVVNGQLDQALKGAGLEVFLTAPDVVAAGDSGHVAVSGLHVRYTQPNDNPAVPTQSVEYILGEARAFAFVVPGEGAPSVSASVGVDAGSSGPSTSGVTTNPSAAHPTATPPTSETATAAAPSGDSPSPIALLRHKPTYLVWLYLIWQALVLATGGALLWWRRAEVVRV